MGAKQLGMALGAKRLWYGAKRKGLKIEAKRLGGEGRLGGNVLLQAGLD